MTLLRSLTKAWNSSERRKHERTSAHSIKLKFNGSTYPSIDWSLGGCQIKGVPEHLGIGDMIEGTLGGIGFSHSGEFLAEIVWKKDGSRVGLRWLELEPHVFERLTRLRGKVA